MKKKIILLALAVVMTASFCLSSCSARLEYKDGVYYCEKNGATYKTIDLHFYPATIGEKFAVLKGSDNMELFEIHGMPTDKWLTTENGDVFCAVDIEEPTLETMQVDKIYICLSGNNGVMALTQISKAEDVNYVMNAYLFGMSLEYPDTHEVSESYVLRLASSKYSWLYYNLSYVEFVEDICISDYPEDLSTYQYREVDESVKVTVVDELECWYRVADSTEQAKYEQLAKDAGISYFTVTKPIDGTVGTFVAHIYSGVDSVDEAVEYFKSEYDGTMADDKVAEAISNTFKTEKVTRVEYNYGRFFVYDRFSGRCVKVDSTINLYKEYKNQD